MTQMLRNLLLLTFAALLLTACGTTGNTDDLPEAQTPEEAEEQESIERADEIADDEAEVSEDVLELAVAFRDSSSDDQVMGLINDAQANGFSDLEIAQALGIATFRAPRKRVMLSVTYVHFRTASATPANELNEVYDYWSTPPWERNRVEEEEEEPEQLTRPRSRSWLDWIPGI